MNHRYRTLGIPFRVNLNIRRYNRAVRDEMMEGHLMTATFVGVQALAHPKRLIEIEAEAVAE